MSYEEITRRIHECEETPLNVIRKYAPRMGMTTLEAYHYIIEYSKRKRLEKLSGDIE